MFMGITNKLSGWKLAITGDKYCWNHSSKSLGSKVWNSGARAVNVRFKIVSRTAAFLMKVMFVWGKQRKTEILFSKKSRKRHGKQVEIGAHV